MTTDIIKQLLKWSVASRAALCHNVNDDWRTVHKDRIGILTCPVHSSKPQLFKRFHNQLLLTMTHRIRVYTQCLDQTDVNYTGLHKIALYLSPLQPWSLSTIMLLWHSFLIITRGQSNLTKSASKSPFPVRGHPRGSKVVPLNSWGRVSY